jgi:hypothetical protein
MLTEALCCATDFARATDRPFMINTDLARCPDHASSRTDRLGPVYLNLHGLGSSRRGAENVFPAVPRALLMCFSFSCFRSLTQHGFLCTLRGRGLYWFDSHPTGQQHLLQSPHIGLDS